MCEDDDQASNRLAVSGMWVSTSGCLTRCGTSLTSPGLLMAVQKWLELALNLSVAVVNTLLVLVVVLNRNSTSAGLLAVAMTSAATLNTNIGVLVIEWTSESARFGCSVER